MLIIDGVQVVIKSLYEERLRNEIIEKIMFILTIFKGTVPMNREIGLETDILDLPMCEAQSKYIVSAIELIEEFENRVTVDEIIFLIDEKNGKMVK